MLTVCFYPVVSLLLYLIVGRIRAEVCVIPPLIIFFSCTVYARRYCTIVAFKPRAIFPHFACITKHFFLFFPIFSHIYTKLFHPFCCIILSRVFCAHILGVFMPYGVVCVCVSACVYGSGIPPLQSTIRESCKDHNQAFPLQYKSNVACPVSCQPHPWQLAISALEIAAAIHLFCCKAPRLPYPNFAYNMTQCSSALLGSEPAIVAALQRRQCR